MLTLNDGRSELWQWDTGRTLSVDADCSQVHFSNKVFGRSIDVDVVDGVAIIPDILLQTDKDLNVWAFVGTAENGYTKISKTFKVNRRNKPADYVFTPQEQITLKDATAILGEAKDVANEAMETAKKAEASADKAAKIADEMIRLADQVEQNTETATKAKADALTAQAKAEEARNAAENAKKAAEEAANSAGTDASAASAAATHAQNAANDAMNALSDTQALYHTMQEYASQAIHNVQTEGDNQVQRVADEGAAQTAAAKEQADRAQSEADRAEAARANAEDVVESCIPDDTAVDGKPWTSKKIVDSLCQPFEESGNPVQCYPVENYPLGIKVSWEPVQKGSGTPSPENIRPIKGRDSVAVERCGENLLNVKPFNKVTNKGITFEYVPDGGIHISGTATDSADCPTFPVWHLPPGKYYGTNTSKEIPAYFVVQRNGENLWLNSKGIFEILAGDVTKYWCAVVSAGLTVDETIYPYIVPGTTASTTYEPYTGQTNTLTLPETVYVGNMDAVSGDGQETWKTLTLDGTTNAFTQNGEFWNLPRNSSPGIIDGSNTDCSHFPHASFSGNQRFGFIFTSAQRMSKYFQDISALNAYLAAQYAAGTPVQICYKLAEPVPFNATGAQPIPALSGVNTIYTDADGVIVTGAEDPKHTITELKNAIISLGGNV